MEGGGTFWARLAAEGILHRLAQYEPWLKNAAAKCPSHVRAGQVMKVRSQKSYTYFLGHNTAVSNFDVVHVITGLFSKLN